MAYPFQHIEAKWQAYWAENQTFKAENQSQKPKHYVLDMFPYPSGAGLHVGHPLGYIASDIYARYKRHLGYNVLHPMGYDSFGLPAEQYAIQTGQHPALTTETNINRYRQQLDKMGFSFDWSRELRTSDPAYYRWTQWIFLQLFHSWYNKETDRAEDIATLVARFEAGGNTSVHAACDDDTPLFTAADWKKFTLEEQQRILLKYRLTYLAEAEVNWCPALGTVLANDEVVNGVSERGGHPVIRKKMTQWSMRISAYAERLLHGLEAIDWPEPLKDMQRHWIGKSVGAEIQFRIHNSEFRIQDDKNKNSEYTIKDKAGKAENSEFIIHNSELIKVFTTRPDTIFGASCIVLAPEHELVPHLTTPAQRSEVEAYITATAKRSERDRMADVKTVSGAFTGAYALHPFTGEKLPVWIADYVLAGYGTGAIMAVPCGDERDYAFAHHFKLPIPAIFEGIDYNQLPFTGKEGVIFKNSGFLNGLNHREATEKVSIELETLHQGKRKVNYRMRDAVFSRQRYWGEPIPIYYKNNIPFPIPEECLPLTLPEIEAYLPTETGEPPLGRATVWSWDEKNKKVAPNGFPLELNTMPGWAGSSWYFNRYMDAQNKTEFASREALNYWRDVDLYIGGSEHATGHLLYARFWQHFLYDKGLVPVKEFAKKLINQGMILGESAFINVLRKKLAVTLKHKDLAGNYIGKEDFEADELFFISADIVEDDELIKKKTEELLVEKIVKNRDLKLVDFEIEEKSSSRYKIHCDVNLVNSSNELDEKGIKKWGHDLAGGIFIKNDKDSFILERQIEKMSKSKYNVVNPDDICEQYGADTLRMYEMFLGPLEQAKPWNTAGITGVHGFLNKLWRLCHSGEGSSFYVSDAPPSAEALKTLHKTIKKVREDMEQFSFNTSVSTFMICVNELTAQSCNSRAVLEPLAILLSPYAPHIAEELWQRMGHTDSIAYAPFPEVEEKYLAESHKEYPVSFNGRVRFKLMLPLDFSAEAIEKMVLEHEKTRQQLMGEVPKKIIIIPGKIINIVA